MDQRDERSRAVQIALILLIAVAGVLYIAVRLGWLGVPAFLVKDKEGKVLAGAIDAYREQDYRLAVERYREYLRLVPEDADAWYGLGVSLGQVEEREEAFRAAHRANELRPGDRRTRGLLALLHVAAGEYERAISIYDRLLAEQGHDQASLGNRAFAYHQWGKKEEALQAYQRAVGEFPNSPELRYSLGVLYYEQREYAKAMEQLRQASHLNLRYEEAYLMMARCARELGDDESAERYARKCLVLVSAGKPQFEAEARELLVAIKRAQRGE